MRITEKKKDKNFIMSISSMIRKINSEACLRFKMFMLKHKILRVFLFSFFYSSTPQKGKKSGEKKIVRSKSFQKSYQNVLRHLEDRRTRIFKELSSVLALWTTK